MQTQKNPRNCLLKLRVHELPTSSGNRIVMQPGSTLEFVESDSGAYRRMIESWLNSPDISDHDFRNVVRTITK